MTEAKIASLADIRKFVTAGNALFTLVSKHTQARKTFLVEMAPPKEDHSPGYFVRLLVGPQNMDDFRYLGFMYHRGDLLTLKPNKDGWGAEAIVCFNWLLSHANFSENPENTDRFFEQAEFWHAGRCGRCGRTLTVPESIASGIGPVCAGM